MIKTLSISEWHLLAEEGNTLPVRIKLNGFSMNPLIRGFQDYVTVNPLEEMPAVGDIVLFKDPDMDRYVVHRVWSAKDGMILTWGDNCRDPDGWMPMENIWGKVILIERGKKNIRPDPKIGIRWAAFMHRVGRPYRFVRRMRKGVNRRLRKTGIRE